MSDEETLARVPHWPRVCHEGNCKRDTVVALLDVRNEKGDRKVGAFSEFGHVKYVHNGKDIWQMSQGYTFVKWLTFCTGHYLQAQRKDC